jgi:hypothetical protein
MRFAIAPEKPSDLSCLGAHYGASAINFPGAYSPTGAMEALGDAQDPATSVARGH